MALIPSDEYPAQVITSDAGWPLGKPQNDENPSDQSGTPLEAAWVADLWGWQQALLDAAGIEASGNPDEVDASQYLDALTTLFQQQLPDRLVSAAVTRYGIVQQTRVISGDWDPTNAGWTSNEVATLILPKVVEFRRQLPKGATLTSVSVPITGPEHGIDWPPEYPPTITVAKRNASTGVLTVFGSYTLILSNQSQYESRGMHTVNEFSGGEVFEEDYDELIVKVSTEAGANALADTRIDFPLIAATVQRGRTI